AQARKDQDTAAFEGRDGKLVDFDRRARTPVVDVERYELGHDGFGERWSELRAGSHGTSIRCETAPDAPQSRCINVAAQKSPSGIHRRHVRIAALRESPRRPAIVR